MEKEKMYDPEKDIRGGLEFIDILVEKIKGTSNKEWFRKQADFTNSILRTANQDAELYSKVKKAVRTISKS
ncbi:MAG: hypothetical protein HYT72_01335 [Candidatus Aenigmarchaeota archaeon]|nr:hypothetical protein [Candidatus Aenigmarchaeota archaeon]